MKKIFLVLKFEIIYILSRKFFLFLTFGIPLIGVLIFSVFSLTADTKFDLLKKKDKSRKSEDRQVEAFVDYCGLIKSIPEELPEGVLLPFSSEEDAVKALENDEISAYYIIPEDYIEKGDLFYIDPGIRPLSSGQSWIIRKAIFANLLENDPGFITKVWSPMEIEYKSIAPSKSSEKNKNVPFGIPYAATMIIVFGILMSSSLLLQSIGEEKKNRVMEVLLLSVTPEQMFTGKIIGLGLIGLLKTSVWAGTGFLLVYFGRKTINLPEDFHLPPSILFWAIVFFILGYSLYASLMAALGALAPNTKEASQSVILIIWPLVLSLMLHGVIVEKSSGLLAVALSLFPLTAPPAMIARLAVGGVPIWQPFLSSALMLVAAYYVIRAAARIFRSQHLLSGQPFSAKKYLKAIFKSG
jgi:ABC-2 type transport system permease protein